MGFYDLSKEERTLLVSQMRREIISDLNSNSREKILKYFSEQDTYIRKKAYIIMGRLFRDKVVIRESIINILDKLFSHENELVRQTTVNTFGEIGKEQADIVFPYFEKAMQDSHHKVRNAVLGSLKKMSEKNPVPTIRFAKKYLNHSNPKIRSIVIHGIELRGRTHPEDILPILRKVQDEKNKKVREKIIHVIGQISYKEGCLQKVLEDLKTWDNKDLVRAALKEIIDVHKQYKKFSHNNLNEVKEKLEKTFNFVI